MPNNDQQVEFTTVLFSEIVDAFDPTRQRENEIGPVVYEFGGGKVLKRDGIPYSNT